MKYLSGHSTKTIKKIQVSNMAFKKPISNI